MGASFITMSHTGDEKSMREAYKNRVDQDAYDFGHSYSGSFSEFAGLQVTSHVFDSAEAADTWLATNTRKWEKAKAVQHKVAVLTEAQEKRVAKLSDQVNEQQCRVYSAQAVWGIAQRRALGRSKVPAYVKAAEAKFYKEKKKLEDLEARILAEYNKAGKRSKKTEWLIGGWVSC